MGAFQDRQQREAHDENAEQGGHQTVGVLDHGPDVVERRDEPAVAQRPVIATALPRARDTDYSALDDEGVFQGSGYDCKSVDQVVASLPATHWDVAFRVGVTKKAPTSPTLISIFP